MKSFRSLSFIALAIAASVANGAVTNIGPVANSVQAQVHVGFTPDKQVATLALALVDGTGGTLTKASIDSTNAYQPFFFESGTLSVTGTAGSVLPVATLSVGKTFVFQKVEVVCLSATSVTAAPVVQVKSGSIALTGTTLLSGSTANTFTPVSASSPETLVVTGTGTAPLSLVIATSGTASALNVRAVVHGFYLP